MIGPILALCLMLLALPAAAGVVAAKPDPDKPVAARQDADWYARFRQKIDGLDTPLFDATGMTPPTCDPDRRGTTLGLFIGAGQAADTGHFLLTGPANDVALFRNALVLRGADPANLIGLTGDAATHDGVAMAARDLLARADCRDSVVLHFSGWALEPRDIGLPEDDGGPFDRGAKIKFLSDLGGRAQTRTPADPALEAAPFAILNTPGPGRTGVLSAAALSELVTLFRNRGADVSVVLDTASATAFALVERQAQVDQRLYSRSVLPGGQRAAHLPGEGCDTCWTPTLLSPKAGALTLFYGTERGDPGIERHLPPETEGAEVFGFLSYQLATAISLSERTTVGALARFVEADAATAIRAQDFSFVSTDPDLDLLVEDRPDRAFQSPQILIDSPELTRAALKLTKPDIEVRGRVVGKGSPIEVRVNGTIAQRDGDNGFVARVRLKAGPNAVSVLAYTTGPQTLLYEFELYYEGDIRAVIGEGKRYALIIANQDYAEGSGITDLKTPIGDARALQDLLVSKYGFVTEARDALGNTTDLFLENADSNRLILALSALEKAAGPRDSVLIFYAGHGEYEKVTNSAYWLPVNAMLGAPLTYFSANALNGSLQRMQAGNVLVISDSCYSGMLLRSTDSGTPEVPSDKRLDQLRRMAESRSRVVMSSGGNQPVLDGGGDGHSVFARALLRALEHPGNTAFSARELHARLLPEVMGRTNLDQEPDFRSIHGAGHDAGDFVFLFNE